MAKVNENFLKLKDDYLFSKILEKTEKYQMENPEKKIIKLGIGDVTLPLSKAVVNEFNKAILDMSKKETFEGYGKVQGYNFLIDLINENEYMKRKINFQRNEIFISSGSKGDLAGILDLFSKDCSVGIVDPVYPAYVDANIMDGRLNIKYLKADAENGFIPEIPNEKIDIIYLNSPNNPTGVVLSKNELERWVKYALENNSIILYDSVYEIFITDKDIPHSIYEIEGAKNVAIEFRSYSKSAGFTGVRSSFMVIPNEVTLECESGEKILVNKLWRRRQSTKFGAASFVTQRATSAVYSEEGMNEILENINYYLENARIMKESLSQIGFTVYGGENSPYIWLKTPNNMASWDFFDLLLNECSVVGTPGVGFGKNGEGYFRLTAFSSKEDTVEALERIKKLKIF